MHVSPPIRHFSFSLYVLYFYFILSYKCVYIIYLTLARTHTLSLPYSLSSPFHSTLYSLSFSYPEQQCNEKFHTNLYNVFGPGGQLPVLERVRVWWHREGYWRTALPMRDAPTEIREMTKFENLFSLCYPSSDLVGHGNKNMGADMLAPYQSTACNLTVDSLTKELGQNPHCRWLSQEEELVLLRQHCQWRSPACSSSFPDQTRIPSKSKKNICLFIPIVINVSTQIVGEAAWIRNPECKVSTKTVNFIETENDV